MDRRDNRRLCWYYPYMIDSRVYAPHEHLFCRFRTSDTDIAIPFVRNELAELARAGITDIVDLTAYTNPLRYSAFTEGSPVRVHGCIGFYLERYVPKRHRLLSAADLALVLRRKMSRVSGSVDIAAIKVAATSGSLSSFERRAFEAAAIASSELDLPVITHSPRGFRDHQRTLVGHGVPPERIALSHPEMDLKGRSARTWDEVYSDMLACVEAGSYLCLTDFTKTGSAADDSRIQFVVDLVGAGHTERLMVSADASWRVHRGKASVRNSSPGSGFGLVAEIHGKLAKAGLSYSNIDVIRGTNPHRFYNLVD